MPNYLYAKLHTVIADRRWPFDGCLLLVRQRWHFALLSHVHVRWCVARPRRLHFCASDQARLRRLDQVPQAPQSRSRTRLTASPTSRTLCGYTPQMPQAVLQSWYAIPPIAVRVALVLLLRR